MALSRHKDIRRSADIELLVVALRKLGRPEAQSSWGRASATHEHMGAKLADAVLQSGISYESVVRPRVDEIATHPTGRTTSGFLAVLRKKGAAEVLKFRRGRKLTTIVELSEFFAVRKVETPAELRTWLETPGNPPSLMPVFGVGLKTISFLKLLVGLDAIAVDVYVRRFVLEAGVIAKDAEIETLLISAGRELALSGAMVDQLIWRSMAKRRKQSSLH